MKISLLTIILLLLTSCTLIGKEIDERASKNSGKPNDHSLENEGFIMDLRFIVAIVTGENKEKETVNPIACKEVGDKQVCTATKGCWCEKI